MSPTPPARRLRLGLPRRVFSQVLLMQVAIAAGVAVLATGLFLAPLSKQLDQEAERRALSIAQTTAQDPQIAEGVLTTPPTADGPVQREAERIRRATHAEYIVVLDRHWLRWSHPITSQIGEQVSTSPKDALQGKEVMEIDQGTLGRSARGKVPLYDARHRIIGAVSVGIAYDSVRARLISAIPGLLAYAGGALAVGALAAWLISRRVQRQTRDLAFSDISALLAEREAMLHGIREGVVAFAPDGRISVVNDEARRLLGLGTALGRTVEEVLPDGRLRRALDGTLSGTDVSVLTDEHCLVVNRMPVTLHGRELGAVVTVRDRTEMVGLLRELDSVRGLTDALRAQQHEFTNRMHTLAGLLDIGEYDDAYEFAVGAAGTGQALTESVRRRIGNSLMVGLLVAKTTVAGERGVRIVLTDDSALGQDPPHLHRLLTIVGNLLDNAVDAAGEGPRPADGREVRLTLTESPHEVRVRVADTGPGIPPDAAESIFEDGFSTRPERGTARRGLGLALVHRLVQRHGGTITVSEGPGAVFTVVLPLPDKALAPQGALFTKALPVGGER